jgi:hypothetical protein
MTPNPHFARQFYANLPDDQLAAQHAEIQSSLTEIFNPLEPVISQQLQSLRARPGMTEEQFDECVELGWCLEPPPIRKIS